VTGPADPGTGSQDPGGEQETPEPVYPCVEDWVEDYFLRMFRRPLGGEFRWCPRWWLHPEAVSRLTAVWRAWEVCRLEPATGISDWYRDHLDHHFAILLGPRGPFFQCAPDTGHIEEPPFRTDPVDFTELDEAVAVTGEPDPGPGGPP
jgi:hypothetical protein